MSDYRYLIIGGGMTAAGAVRGIRKEDPEGKIAILGAEKYKPYKRPPLTKKLWHGKPESSIWLPLPEENLDILLDCEAVSIDPQRRAVKDSAGSQYRYERLLLATGGAPRKLPDSSPAVLYFRDLDDYHTLRGWAGKNAHFGVIGGGFIGSEVAAILAEAGERVTMVFPEKTIGERIYPADLAGFITDYFRQKGVEIRDGVPVESVQERGEKLAIRTPGGEEIAVDHVIAGLGLRPNIDLAQAAGIQIAGREAGGGIQVNENLQTSQPDIYAAGDAASFYHAGLERYSRVEHEDNALTMGFTAGQNMAGSPAAYRHQPYFYSDLFDLGYEAVGDLDARLETFEDWKEPFRTGVVYYLRDNRVRGVLLWNTWDQVEAARRLIASRQVFAKDELKGRLPE